VSDREALDRRWREMLSTGDMPGATRFLGFEFIDFDSHDGWCEAAFHPNEHTLNPAGKVQGGFISAMLDEVMSIAGSLVQPVYSMVPTLQMTTNFLRPVPAARLIARGEVVRSGRTTVHTRGMLYDTGRKLLAEASAACVPRAL
jgi:uncharacterized protein (TIGR00369 family)